ncbi:hypothetical protein FGW37_03590 [Streptomyces rectiverticillatus]|nr:hypothetical protein FGW37_03590 [Streptomyces rectiverticillatus]
MAQDICDAQHQLHEAHAELAALCQTLPWSVEPHEGWARPRAHWHPTERPATDGWTQEQQDAVAALRARAVELSLAVSAHPFWGTVERGDVVAARMTLKQLRQEPTAEVA